MLSSTGTKQKEPLVFGQMVEALFTHVLRGKLDEDTRKRLKIIGIDLERPPHMAYPLQAWFAAINVCAEVLYPNLSREEARYLLGHQLAEGYGRTTLGRSLFTLLRMLGWRGSLSHISRALQLGTNFLSARTRFLERGELEVVFEVLPSFHAALGTRPGIDPHFMNGNMDAMMEQVGAPFSRGEPQPIEPGSQRVTFLLRPR